MLWILSVTKWGDRYNFQKRVEIPGEDILQDWRFWHYGRAK
ncbi:hypothetical protein [Anabaena sp. CCY 9910]